MTTVTPLTHANTPQGKLFGGLNDGRMEKTWVRFGCPVLPGQAFDNP